jgi:oxygen-independent coproporphyrinogen-3 oxidase
MVAAAARSDLPEAGSNMTAPSKAVTSRLGLSGPGAPTEPSPPEGLYVHFPFCVSICPYCDFVVVAASAARGPRSGVDALLEAQLQELELRAREPSGRAQREPSVPLRSVYLGGGTPSLMTAAHVARLLVRIRELFGIAADAEVTLEANPGREEIGDLTGFRDAGIHRLSIGAQSLDSGELRRLGRRHSPHDVAAAIGAARDAGFTSVSLDLLTDIPGQTLDSWRRTLLGALDLAPDHLSVYSLTLDDPDADGLTGVLGDHLPTSRGARTWRTRAEREQSEDRAAAMELLTDELAGAAGLRRYEIANLARPGFESRHNLLYWRRRPYLGIGPGAHSFDGARRRRWNAASLRAYTEALAAGRLPPGGTDELDDATALAEGAILGLRLMEGISETLAARPELAAGLTWARGVGLVEEVDERTRLTVDGRLLANEVFVRLLPGSPAVPRPAVGAGRAVTA